MHRANTKEKQQNRVIGYARVSTIDQHTAIQKVALQRFGCVLIVEEKASGSKQRPKLDKLLLTLRPGDTLVVHKLDRLARSMQQFIKVFETLKDRGVKLHSLVENLDVSTAQGRMFIQVLAAFAELEREMIRERCMSGQHAARAQGRTWGVKRLFTDTECKEHSEMWRSGWWKQKTIAQWLCVNLNTLRLSIYRYERRGFFATRKLDQ